METYCVIDQETWPRRAHCAVFRDYLEPSFCVTLELDVTSFYKQVKAQGYGFTPALIYTVATCANRIPAFRYRFIDEQVVLFDRIHTAFTTLVAETELFKVVEVEMTETLGAYVALARAKAAAQAAYFTGPLGIDVFQFSPLPWIAYTHVSHTISGKRDQATPLFDWGKYTWRGDRLMLPFSVQAHHCFVDGLHIGRLVEDLQQTLHGPLLP